MMAKDQSAFPVIPTSISPTTHLLHVVDDLRGVLVVLF